MCLLSLRLGWSPPGSIYFFQKLTYYLEFQMNSRMVAVSSADAQVERTTMTSNNSWRITSLFPRMETVIATSSTNLKLTLALAAILAWIWALIRSTAHSKTSVVLSQGNYWVSSQLSKATRLSRVQLRTQAVSSGLMETSTRITRSTNSKNSELAIIFKNSKAKPDL